MRSAGVASAALLLFVSGASANPACPDAFLGLPSGGECPDPFTVMLTIPVDGDASAGEMNGMRCQLAEQEIPSNCHNLIINAQLQAQQQANAMLSNTNYEIDNQILTCQQNFINEHNLGAINNQGAYVAAVVGSEEEPLFVPACECDVGTEQTGFVQLMASDLTPRHYIVCGANDWDETTPNDYGGGESHGEYGCEGQNHVHYTVHSMSSNPPGCSNIQNCSPEQLAQLDGVQPYFHEGAFTGAPSVNDATQGYDLCNFFHGGIAHRDNHSCFAPEARIMMADKSYKMIKHIKFGDMVWNPVLNKPVKVAKVVIGPEPTPLLEIKYGTNTLRVSQRHPMITPANAAGISQIALSDSPLFASASKPYVVTMASELEVGDSVLGADGKFHPVESIRQLEVEEDQLVYNLALEDLSMSLEAHAVLADGFITGDYSVQQDVNAELREQVRDGEKGL